jgi:hypothetical protein
MGAAKFARRFSLSNFHVIYAFAQQRKLVKTNDFLYYGCP